MTINAFESGRSLHVLVGGKEDGIEFTIAPIPTRKGAELLASWTKVVFGLVEDQEEAESTAVDFTKVSLGEENYARLDDLRWAEAEKVANAAFLWNVQCGGIDVVNEMLLDGFPKARETVMKAANLWDAYLQLRRLHDGGVGEPDPVTGRYPRYNYPAWYLRQLQQRRDPRPEDDDRDDGSTPVTRDLYKLIATQWDQLIQPDLLEVYGLDPESPVFLERRWRATFPLIVALLTRESHTRRALTRTST